MTQRGYFFDATAGSPSYNAADFNRVLGWFRGEGVLPGHLNELEVYADSSGMQVKVRSGRALLDPKNNYSAAGLFESDAQETLPIAAANPTYPRIDRVVVRRTAASKAIALAVLQGTPAASPTPPALTRTSDTYEISLAQVRVEAGAVTISADKVTDERSDSAVCGWADFTARKVVSPASKDLSVEGDQVIVRLGDAAGAKKLLVRDSTGATVFSIDSDGRVEIGNIRNAAIGDGQINARTIEAGTISTSLLADGAVIAAKLADGACLTEILDDDGSGSGLDADLLDGQQGSYYLSRANHAGTQAPSTISPQGAGSGLGADTVDGVHAGTGAGQALVLDGSGKVPVGNLPLLELHLPLAGFKDWNVPGTGPFDVPSLPWTFNSSRFPSGATYRFEIAWRIWGIEGGQSVSMHLYDQTAGSNVLTFTHGSIGDYVDGNTFTPVNGHVYRVRTSTTKENSQWSSILARITITF